MIAEVFTRPPASPCSSGSDSVRGRDVQRSVGEPEADPVSRNVGSIAI
jgi:hypothetical protein